MLPTDMWQPRARRKCAPWTVCGRSTESAAYFEEKEKVVRVDFEHHAFKEPVIAALLRRAGVACASASRSRRN